MKKIAGMSLLIALIAPMVALAGASAWNVDKDGVVLGGYDVVAYHTQDKAIQGSSRYSTNYDGVVFHFANAENLAEFKKGPASYVPSFGGYCAFGVAKNHAKVPVDPTNFKIYNGDLLLFFHDMYQGKKVNTKIFWNRGERELHKEAVKVWPTLQ